MEGKIIVYSDETGLGKIITPEKKKYNFSIDEWDEYEAIPQIGAVVHFDPEGINARRITLRQKEIDTPNPNAVNNPQPAVSSTPIHPSKIEKSDSGSPAILDSSMEVEECIRIDFAPILKSIDENARLLEENRRLDFLRMRRFLNTAYNNLIEIDHSFENFKLAEIRQQLFDAYGNYKEFRAKTAYVQKAYEKVFLSKQIRYKELRAKLDLNKVQIAKLNESAANREIEIREKSRKLSTLSPRSEEYIYLFNEIKLLKRTMVDAIHEVAKLVEENRLYIDLLDNFYKMHYRRFKEAFDDFVRQYDEKLRKIQDVLAYRFDSMIWERANRSKPIQKYFSEAGITDEFSAVTYLKYYIKTLDASKLNEQNQELVELLHYLQQQTKKRILCIDDDTDFLMSVKQVIGEIDRDIKVTLSTRAETILPDLKNIKPNILLLNPTITKIDIEAAVEYARKNVPDIEIALVARRINRDILMAAKRLNAAAIIPKTSDRGELKEQFRQYIA